MILTIPKNPTWFVTIIHTCTLHMHTHAYIHGLSRKCAYKCLPPAPQLAFQTIARKRLQHNKDNIEQVKTPRHCIHGLLSHIHHFLLPHNQHQLLVHSATPPAVGRKQLAMSYRRVLPDLVRTGCVCKPPLIGNVLLCSELTSRLGFNQNRLLYAGRASAHPPTPIQ